MFEFHRDYFVKVAAIARDADELYDCAHVQVAHDWLDETVMKAMRA